MIRMNKQTMVWRFFAAISLPFLISSLSLLPSTTRATDFTTASSLDARIAAGQWTQTSGPCGGTVRSLLTSGDYIFAGTNTGVFLSTNNGQNWTAANKGLTGITINSLAISGNNLFAGTFGRGIFRSTDNGQNWTAVNNGLASLYIGPLVVSGNKIFAGAGGVCVSNDNGQSWTVLLAKGINSLAMNGNSIFAGTTSEGVLLSADNGQTWVAANNGLTSLDSSLNIISLAVSGNNLIAGVLYGSLFLSTNNGQSWTPVNNRLSVTSPGFSCLAVNGNNVFAGAEDGLILSTDNGRNWMGVTTMPVSAIAVSGNNLFAGNFRGVFLSTNNGQNWTAINKGIINTWITTLVVSQNILFAATFSNGVFRSIDNGQNWSDISGNLPIATINSLAVNGTTLFVATSNRGVFRSTINGQNWVAVNNGLTSQSINSLVADGSYLFVGTGGGVFRSTDNGLNWTAVNNGLPSSFRPLLTVTSGYIFAYSDQGFFRSTNNGEGWAAINGLSDQHLCCLLMIVNNLFVGNSLFVGTIGNGILLSTNNGESWRAVNNGLTNLFIRALATSGNAIIASTDDGPFLSTDSGQHWTAINSGLFNKNIDCLAVSGNFIFVGTRGDGVFRGSDFVSRAATVSAASYDGRAIATESIAAAFGSDFATTTQIADVLPLPTSLAGASIRVRDSAGIERLAPLFFVSPSQINFQIPPGTAAGVGRATIASGNAGVSISPLQISSVAPGLFTANANGQGVPAAVVLRIQANGTQIYEPLSRFDQAQNRFVSVPIEIGQAGDQVFLLLYGTGIRYRSSLSAVAINFGGLDAQVTYAGPQTDFIGLDQINVRLPTELAGRGEVFISLKADGITANPVQVNIK